MKQKIILLCCLAVTGCLSAQVCDNHRLTVQIETSTFKDRIARFKQQGGKQEKLTALLGGTVHPAEDAGYEIFEFFTKLKELMNMGDGVRVYFGAFTANGIAAVDAPFAAGRTYRLVPIFVPTIEESVGYDYVNKDVPDVYYIPDVINKKGLKPIKSATAKAWIKNYVNTVLPELKKTLPAGDTKGDTRALWYNNKDLEAWRKEILCQHDRPGSRVNTISLCWGTYETNYSFLVGVAYPQSTGVKETVGRLTLQFQVPEAAVPTASQRQQLFKDRIRMYNDNLKNLSKETDTKNSAKNQKNAIAPNNKAGVKRPKTMALLDLSGEFDTGVPCPPADNCEEP